MRCLPQGSEEAWLVKIARTRDDAKEPGAYSVPMDSPLGQELARFVIRTRQAAGDACDVCYLKRAAKSHGARFMQALASRFPTLREADGVSPWDPEKLDAWACGPKRTGGGWHAAMFVLSVWRPHAQWRCGRFSAALAMQVWDEDHRAAFAAWAVAGGYTP